MQNFFMLQFLKTSSFQTEFGPLAVDRDTMIILNYLLVIFLTFLEFLYLSCLIFRCNHSPGFLKLRKYNSSIVNIKGSKFSNSCITHLNVIYSLYISQ